MRVPDPWPGPKAFQKEKSSAEASHSEQSGVQMERYGKIWKVDMMGI
jgi:hypothetical protein